MMTTTIYSVNDIDIILNELDIEFIKDNKRHEYINVPFSFDIETSSFLDEEGDKVALMYAFVFGINDKCIIGRTWEEFLYLLNKISSYFNLDINKRVIIWVHNLAFEFQFIRKLLTWENVFAVEERKPVKALTNIGIEFRCTYLLSGYSLEYVAKNLTLHTLTKKVGDLDYSKLRTSITPLTDDELGYILYDGLIVLAYVKELIINNGNITKLPMTKTGFVRNYVRKECYGKGTKKNFKTLNKWRNYRNIMNSLCIKSVQEYKQLKRAFMGGFTHANAIAVGLIIDNVHSFDFTSSYPYVMISEKFPMSSGEVIKITNKEEFEKNIKLYCCLFDVKFIGLKPTRNEHPLSFSKCNVVGDYELNNGRIVHADEVSTTLTEQDYFIIKDFYKWDKILIGTFRRYRKGYLPRDFIKSILTLYEKKTTLKGVEGKEVEYLRSKEDINSCYGMCVTDICRDDIIFDDEWLSQECNIQEVLEKHNNSLNRFLFYGWGIWVTAYARRNLFTGIKELGNDYIYADTDSLKFINLDVHKDYFNRYNEIVVLKLKKAMEHHKLPFEMCTPTTIEGKVKTLGVWDYEGMYKKFKTLGAKRYMIVDENDKLSLTISGVNKKHAVPYLLKKYGSNDAVLRQFKEGMLIPKDYTGKMTHTYIDDLKCGIVKDYLGNYYQYKALSGVHLENAEYELSMSVDFINFIMKVKERE